MERRLSLLDLQGIIMKFKIGKNTLIWAENDHGNLTGIQGLIIDGVAQMSEDYPSQFIFQSPDGWDYRQFLPIETINNDDSLIIKTEAIGSTCDTSWYRDQYDDDILQVGRPQTPPTLYINFIITPVEITHGKHNFKGIHIDWQFSSESVKLGSLRWMQHWELEGNCEGTTIYWQSQIAPPVVKLTRESEWDNICWKSLQNEKKDSNISMQMNSRVAYHQLFDFHRTPKGIFLAYFPKAQNVQTFCKKNSGETEYHIVEKLNFPVDDSGQISGKTILFANDVILSSTAQRNLWFEINEYMENSYREQTNIIKSRNLPTKTHWMWGAIPSKDHVYYDPTSDGSKIPAEAYLEWLGLHEMPKAAKAGFKRFWTRPYCKSDASELMFWNKSMQGKSIMDGDVTIGSCCCVQEYTPAAMYGAGKMAKRFYELGHKNNMDVGIWVGNHLSTKAPILKEHPEWILKSQNFSNPVGGYDDQILAVVDWNSGAKDWILNDLLKWKENYGLDFIFFDSLGNLGLKTRNYNRKDLADNFAGLTKFISELTHNGIEVICEGRSFIGAPHFGISNDGNMESSNDPLRGQNSLGWFLNNEDMFCGIEAFTNENKKINSEKIINMHFRILATGGLLDISKGPEELTKNQLILNQVSKYMKTRVLLEDDQGVIWESKGCKIFFTFKNSTLELKDKLNVQRVTANGLINLGSINSIEAKTLSVFIIGTVNNSMKEYENNISTD
jgi:hypothetical protein